MSAQAPSSTSHLVVLLVALNKQNFFDNMYSRLIDTLASRATLKRASKPSSAITYLSTNTPTAIIITDSGITESTHVAVLEKVISYVRDGGIAILAGHFSSYIRPHDLNRHFRSHWHLPWEFGDYYRTTVNLNRSVRQVPMMGLPDAYSQKAVFLRNVGPDAALYLPSRDSMTESHVFPSEPVGDVEQAPVAFAAIGQGWLGYVGDVNAEEGSDAVIVAMCGL